MVIQFCSDLHIEFEANRRFLQQNPIQPVADILILAGDITYLGQKFFEDSLFDYFSQNWQKVFWLPGNHEFYGDDILNYDFSKPINIRQNVLLLNNNVIEIDDIKLIFTTLWTELDPRYLLLIVNSVADFDYIHYGGHILTAEDYNSLHYKSLAFLREVLKNNEKQKRTVVVTHHLPSYLCIHNDFKNSRINSAFYVDLTSMIEQNNIDVWIYGHSHRNMPDFYIGQTLLTTNQLGYVHLNEHHSFNSSKTLKL